MIRLDGLCLNFTIFSFCCCLFTLKCDIHNLFCQNKYFSQFIELVDAKKIKFTPHNIGDKQQTPS